MSSTPEDHLSGFVVAIDGPSGSGKSSVSKQVARTLGYGYLDTGAMYRALTWWCLREDVDLDDPDAITAAAERLPLSIGTDPDDPTVTVDGVDVTADIRETRISTTVSAVAAVIPVRELMRVLQRRLISEAARRRWGRGRGPRHHDRRGARRTRADPAHRLRGGPSGPAVDGAARRRRRGIGRGHAVADRRPRQGRLGRLGVQCRGRRRDHASTPRTSTSRARCRPSCRSCEPRRRDAGGARVTWAPRAGGEWSLKDVSLIRGHRD